MASPNTEIPTDMDNCSTNFPLSHEYFRDISNVEMGIIILCGISTVLTILCFGEQVHFVFHNYETSPSIMHKSVQILGTYPVISLIAMVALIVPRAALVSDLVGSVYIAWSLFNFTNLIVDYLGGEEKLLSRFQGEKIKLQSPPLACCCPCLPKIELNRKNLKIIQLLVFQTAVLQPLIGFLSVVLWVDNKYMNGEIKADNAYPYLVTPNGISTLVAMYGMILVFRISRGALKAIQIQQKFVVLQLVLIFFNLQGFLFNLLEKLDLPKCRGVLSSKIRGQAFQHMLVVGEMMILAVIARCFYRRPHGSANIHNGHIKCDNIPPSETTDFSAGTRDCIPEVHDTFQSNENSHKSQLSSEVAPEGCSNRGYQAAINE